MVVPEFPERLKTNYPELTEVFSREWKTPLSDYARRLYLKSPGNLEPALLSAFEQELKSMVVDPVTINQVLDQLQRIPVLQTSHHITPTHGPTFLTLDLICLAGIETPDLYLVAANSGVSFSNSAWSGALSYGSLPLESLVESNSTVFQQALKSQRDREAHGDSDSRISLIQARQRDRLVFGTRMTDHQPKIYRQFSRQLQTVIPKMEEGLSFSQWSAASATAIQNRVFDTQRILVFDINRVIARYLVNVLSHSPDHPCSVLLSDSTTASEILAAFSSPTMFLGTYQGKKSNKVDPLSWTGTGLNSLKTGHLGMDRQALIQQLSAFELCPGIFLLFFILRFINGIRCLGSFNQIGYLETYRQLWRRTANDWQLDLDPDYHSSLTTGRLIREGKPVWPLDLVMNQKHLSVETFSGMEMGYFWQPIVEQLSKKVE